MNGLDELLERIYQDGVRNDSEQSSRSLKMLNITPSTGRFLELLIRDLRPKNILEVGTSNGYSTLWLARAAHDVGAKITSLDCSAAKHQLARANLVAGGFSDSLVTLVEGDAGEFLKRSPAGIFDFIFLDSDRSFYRSWASDLFRCLGSGLMVVDNATSHPAELTDFRAVVDTWPGCRWVVLPIGNGELLISKEV